MNIKKKMSNKSIRGVIWHDIARGFYADRFRYLIAVLMLAGVLIILGNHEFGMMDTIFFIQGGYDPVLIIKEGTYMKLLKDKVAVVTGGTRGIGAAIVRL